MSQTHSRVVACLLASSRDGGLQAVLHALVYGAIRADNERVGARQVRRAGGAQHSMLRRLRSVDWSRNQQRHGCKQQLVSWLACSSVLRQRCPPVT